MTQSELHTLIEGFANKHILLLGDVMLDAYVWGTVNRMSPEAPVPVLDVTKREERLGGLANVALNLKELGCKVSIVSVVGNDEAGKKIMQQLRELQIDPTFIFPSENRKTTVKTRVISDNKHVIRIDEEQTNDISTVEENIVLEMVNTLVQNHKPDCILFEDYNKGNLTETLIPAAIEIARQNHIVTCVDPKRKNFLTYRNVDLFKPNLKEIREGLSVDVNPIQLDQLVEADKLLRQKLNHSMSLITLSEHGVFYCDQITHEKLPAHPRHIVDVSGAGDTVIAVAALALASGMNSKNITWISNLAGGLVCEKVGVVPISKQQLYEEASRLL